MAFVILPIQKQRLRRSNQFDIDVAELQWRLLRTFPTSKLRSKYYYLKESKQNAAHQLAKSLRDELKRRNVFVASIVEDSDSGSD